MMFFKFSIFSGTIVPKADNGNVEYEVEHHAIEGIFVNIGFALPGLDPPDPHLVHQRLHLHLAQRQFLFSSHLTL